MNTKNIVFAISFIIVFIIVLIAMVDYKAKREYDNQKDSQDGIRDGKDADNNDIKVIPYDKTNPYTIESLNLKTMLIICGPMAPKRQRQLHSRSWPAHLQL